MMKAKLWILMAVVMLTAAGCQAAAGTAPESSAPAPTGYPSEEVQRISLFYNGCLYLYNATGFDLPQEEGWMLLGQVASVNNQEWPSEDFCGTHLEVGQEIYCDPEEPQKLYVKYDNGFALFETEDASASVQTGIKAWSSTSLELKLTNCGSETIGYGEGYTLEILQGDAWEPLPVVLEEYGFPDILYELEPGACQFLDIEFEWLYGELPPGSYRIVKEIYPSEGDPFLVSSEFWL